MVLTFTIACKCIRQSIALNRWGCTESRAKCCTSQPVSSTHCDEKAPKNTRAEVTAESEWKYKSNCSAAFVQLSCSCACVFMSVWPHACVARLQACVSLLCPSVRCKHREALRGCSPEGLHRATASPPSREAADESPPSLQAQI